MTFAPKIDTVPSFVERNPIKTLTDLLPDVDQLSEEDQAGLAAHLLAKLRGAPLGPDDEELARREAEIGKHDSNRVCSCLRSRRNVAA